jgi:hypothetical protein
MPFIYYYFESSEVAHERFRVEIELLKQLQTGDLLHDLDWSSYDTLALTYFVRIGIEQAKKELIERQITTNGISYNRRIQLDFVHQCCRQWSNNERVRVKHMPRHLLVNVAFIVVTIGILYAMFIHESIRYHGQHVFRQTLTRPLTSQRRHLTFNDDLLMIILTIVTSIVVGCTIVATRWHRTIVLLGMIILFFIVSLLVKKMQQIIVFLSTFREQPWRHLFNYFHS